MSTTVRTIDPPPARMLHRLAVLAVCLVWPLIWIGGLVTTVDAGMAVPDWPNTYGYNLFLYPYKTWLSGPFDLFIEHGHRLLAALVGLVAIGILFSAYRWDPRRWVTIFAAAILLGVIGQGVLGGLRVVLGDRTLAMVHGCVAPAFFALCVVMAAVTSRSWWQQPPEVTEEDSGQTKTEPTALAVGTERTVDLRTGPEASAFGSQKMTVSSAQAEPEDRRPKIEVGSVILVVSLVCVSYAQLVLGAQLRHVQPTTAPGGFAMTVALHVMTAFLLWLLTLIVWWRLRGCGDLTLSRPARWLVGLLLVQVLLGTGTWIVNYGWPSLLSWVPGSTGFLLRAKGFSDSIIVTAHVAMGALILAVSALVLVRLMRIRDVRQSETGRGSAKQDNQISTQSAAV